MKNIYFPDEDVTSNDLLFVCYMIERVSRRLKQPNIYTAEALGTDALRHELSVANVQHCENPLDVEDRWIERYHLVPGTYDVSDVDPELCEHFPSAIDIAKVYRRLMLNTTYDGEDYDQAILRVYHSPICRAIDNYNGSAFYEPPIVVARAYYEEGFH